MAPQVDHILLTRFNLPSPGHESYIRSRPAWLEGRVELFQRYCLPSVQGQRDRNSSWLIYFDPESPDWLKSWVESVCDGAFTPVYRAAVSASDLREDLDRAVPRKSRTLITTNLDNDDGLGFDFVARARRFEPRAPRTALYFGRGLILDAPRLFVRKDRANAFCSVVESWDEPVTCWTDWHNRLHRTMPVDVLLGDPQWLQVVHGTNVSNRPRGRLVAPGRHARSFIGLDDVAEPTRGELRADRFLYSHGRAARDAARSTARRAAVAALGKDGLNRAKESLATRRLALDGRVR